jgi:hypothetical protein
MKDYFTFDLQSVYQDFINVETVSSSRSEAETPSNYQALAELAAFITNYIYTGVPFTTLRLNDHVNNNNVR